MFSYFPSGVSNQRAADGNGYFLPVNWQTYTGNGSFSVQADCVPSSCNNLTAAVIRSRRCVVGRPAGRRAGVYHNSDHVEIILEKDLRRQLSMQGKIITISRQCGSGGHSIGSELAQRLDVPFYDREIGVSI